jgi:predicted dehydrogenase
VVSHQHRYGAHYRKVKEYAESGKLGRIETIYASATGWMTHMMSHLVDYMLWYNGYNAADWVMAQAAGKIKLADNHPSPDYIAGVVNFKNGVRGIVECGAGAPDQPDVEKWWGKNRICVQGTAGFAEVLTNGGWRAVTADGAASGPGAMNYDVDMPPYVQEMADWLADGGKPHQCCWANAFQGFEITMAMCRSALQGGQVALPLDPGPAEIEELKKKLSDRKVMLSSEVNAKEYFK